MKIGMPLEPGEYVKFGRPFSGIFQCAGKLFLKGKKIGECIVTTLELSTLTREQLNRIVKFRVEAKRGGGGRSETASSPHPTYEEEDSLGTMPQEA